MEFKNKIFAIVGIAFLLLSCSGIFAYDDFKWGICKSMNKSDGACDDYWGKFKKNYGIEDNQTILNKKIKELEKRIEKNYLNKSQIRKNYLNKSELKKQYPNRTEVKFDDSNFTKSIRTEISNIKAQIGEMNKVLGITPTNNYSQQKSNENYMIYIIIILVVLLISLFLYFNNLKSKNNNPQNNRFIGSNHNEPQHFNGGVTEARDIYHSKTTPVLSRKEVQELIKIKEREKKAKKKAVNKEESGSK
jgi:hypothetical protein